MSIAATRTADFRLLLALLLCVAAGTAGAAPQWQLVEVTRYVSLSGDAILSFPAADLSGSLQLEGSRIVATAAWTDNSEAAWVDYEGAWRTELGKSVDILKLSETCVQGTDTGGTSISCGRIPGGQPDPRDDGSAIAGNGLEGDWISGQNQRGQLSPLYVNDVILEGTGLQRGDTITIIRRTLLIDPCLDCFAPLPAELRLNYTLVPLPPALWLFLSAIGLAALARVTRARSPLGRGAAQG